MDDSDCVPRPFVPRISVPFVPVVRTRRHEDYASPESDRRSRDDGNSAPLLDGRGSPPRSVTPRPYAASLYSPPSKDPLLDDSLLCLTPEKTNDALLAEPASGCRVETKENRRARGAPEEDGSGGEGNSNPSINGAERTLRERMNKLSISTKERKDGEWPREGKSVQFASSKVLRAEDSVTSSSSTTGVKLYIHGIPGGGATNSSVDAGGVPKTKSQPASKSASKRSTSTANVASKSNSSKAKNGFPVSLSKLSAAKCSKPSASSSNTRAISSRSSTSSSPTLTTTSLPSARSTTAASSLPSARPELNSLLLSARSSRDVDRERSFDSVVAAEDLLRDDVVVRNAVRHRAAQRTNVPKDKKIFDNLVPLIESDDVDQILGAEEESARRRRLKGRKNVSSNAGGRGGARTRPLTSSSRDGSRNRYVDLADRSEPDIRDFWNPEWEIGRPDWRLPFGTEEVVVEDGFHVDEMIVERAADLSDVVARIERRAEHKERVKRNFHSMFYF